MLYQTFSLFLADAMSQFDFGKEMLRMLFSLGALVLLLVLTVFIIKKLSSQRLTKLNTTSSIRIEQKRNLSAKTTLYVIEFEGKKLLISESPLQVNALHQKYEKMSDKEFAHLTEESKKEA